MIPKIIHYCWFGRGKMPKLALKCIESWKKILPEYEVKRWDEDNFDLDMYPYAREAYDNRKFAFVSDVVRLYALYTEGGVYMDTDVEVLKPLDQFLNEPAFSGFESPNRVPTGIMASEKGGLWAKENLEYYDGRHFLKDDGSFDMTSNVKIITDYMLKKGIVLNNTLQRFPGLISLYPTDYFCPLEHGTYKLLDTKNTCCIHYYSGSWITPRKRFVKRIRRIVGPTISGVLIKTKRFFKKCFKKNN